MRPMLSIEMFRSDRSTPLRYVRLRPHSCASASWLKPRAARSRRIFFASTSRSGPLCVLFVQTNWRGVLVKVLADHGDSVHPEGSYEKPQPINWPKSAESYVFCSKVRPATISRDGEGWRATIL